MAAQTMTQADYARHRGVSRAMVTKWVNAGTIKRTTRGRIKVAEADAVLDELATARVQKQEARTTVAGITYTQARTMKEAFAAKMAKLEYEKRQGQLIEKSEAQRQAFNAARRTRDALLAVGSRTAALARAAKSDFEAEQIITREIQNALENLSQQLAAGDG